MSVESPPAASSPSSYSSTFFSYFYNSVASISNAVSGEAMLADNVPCHILGQCYQGPKTTQWATKAVRKVAYFTYRKKLPRPLSNGSDHDAGWGCMIRTGQMMLCQALRRLYGCEERVTNDPIQFALLRQQLDVQGTMMGERAGSSGGATSPSDQSRILFPSVQQSTAHSAPCLVSPPSSTTESSSSSIFHIVQSLFQDTPEAPFGLYKFTEEGARVKCSVGSWFSPTVLARSVASLVPQCAIVDEKLDVVAALDQTIVTDEIIAKIDEDEKAVLILIPVMFGMATIGKSYEQVLLRLLEAKTSVGVVGGRPKQSLYFVGHQQDNVFYLDPHVVQPAYVSKQTIGNVEGPRGTAAVSSLDPCMLLCFLVERVDDFLSLCDEFTAINRLGEFPIVTMRTNQKAPPSGEAHAASLGRFVEADDLGMATHNPDDLDDCDFDDDLL